MTIFSLFSLSVFQVFSFFSAVVYLPEDPAPAEKKGAEELAAYWQKGTGQELIIRPEPKRDQRRPRYHRFGGWRPAPDRDRAELAFFVGETRAARVHAPLPPALAKDGFVWRRSGNNVFLRGKSAPATQYAVYRLLHQYAQIRWYLPTELGEHVPAFAADQLPRRINRVESPDFGSRLWGQVTRSRDDPWEVRNLMGRRDRFHHNLHRVFTEAVYDLRPDFFILLGGERIRPDDSMGGLNHQICFGNPDAAKFAARKAAEFFDQNPEETSFSLGMTDTDAICQCPDCQRWVDPEKTFRDRPDYSDLVFTFMNRAAEELGKTHPDKFLGCLAYYWAENVPSFPVHPKVMPYLTADRSQWHNEAFRREDRDLMSRWSEAGPERIGIYDYYYGSSFVIPRLFTAITEDSLRHAREVGIDGFYAEIYSTWSLDGPKAWLTSQLLWDTNADREELLGQFYRDLFGEAAEPMRLFFERCEEIWMNQGEPVFWLKFYHDFTQLELFPPGVCGELRRLLDDASERAFSNLERERVALISEGFRLTELYSQLYYGVKEAASAAGGAPGDRAGQGRVVSPRQPLEEGASSDGGAPGGRALPGEAASLDLLMDLIEQSISHREALEAYYEQVILRNDLHRPFRRIEERAGFLPGMKLNRLVERLAALSEGEEAQLELEVLIASLSVAYPESRAGVVWKRAGRSSRELLLNGSFEEDALWIGSAEGLVENPDYIPFSWNRPAGEGTEAGFMLSDAEARQGEFSLLSRGAVSADLFQRFSVNPGEVYRFSAWSKGKVSPGSRVEIQLSWRDAKGEVIAEEFQSVDRLLPKLAEEWQELLVFVAAPPGAARAFASLVIRNQGPDDVVFFDEVSLQRVEP